MDNAEAAAVLEEHLAAFVNRPYAELAAEVGRAETIEAKGPSGTAYQIELNVLYDSVPGGDLRIMGSIDAGFWRAFAPLCKSAIMKPDGELV